MKKDWILSISVSAVTVVIALVVIRWYAPQLLGYGADVQMVRVSKTVPPFYAGVFRQDDRESKSFIISDPLIVNRAQPLFPNIGKIGPNDILGFRNRAVPNIADIITIGDSQTYGNNASLEQNWPGYLEQSLDKDYNQVVYNMSVGAWGGTNYLQIFKTAIFLQPKIVVVAYYTGNDPISDFRNAYTYDEWSDLRPDDNLSVDDAPKVTFPPPASDRVTARYDDGIVTVFTPSYRYASNRYSDPAVRAGYKIMAATAVKIRDLAVRNNIDVYFTIIPTKELVYAKKTIADRDGIAIAFLNQQDNLDQQQVAAFSAAYFDLVRDETKFIKELASALKNLEGAKYFDVVTPLQQKALEAQPLYPVNGNGHPVASGYRVIADTVYRGLQEGTNYQVPYGLVGLMMDADQVGNIGLYSDRGYEIFDNESTIFANGWNKNDLVPLTLREISNFSWGEVIDVVKPSQYGPEYIKRIKRIQNKVP